MRTVSLAATREHGMVLALVEHLAAARGGVVLGTAAELFGAMKPILQASAAGSAEGPTSATHLDHLLREIGAISTYRSRVDISQPTGRTWLLRCRAPARPVVAAAPAAPRPAAPKPAARPSAAAPHAAAPASPSAAFQSAPIPPAPRPPPQTPRAPLIEAGSCYTEAPINIAPFIRAVVATRGGDVTLDARGVVALLNAHRDVVDGKGWSPIRVLPSSAAQANILLRTFLAERTNHGVKRAREFHAGLDVEQIAQGPKWRIRIAEPTKRRLPEITSIGA